MRDRFRFDLPPPPLSLFVLILTLIFYFYAVAPEMQRSAKLLKLRQETALTCTVIDCTDQVD
jgi:hypothetical protein